MKQFAQRTELDLEVRHTSDSRLYAIYHGARRLRYLCIPHTPYEKCVMCCRTIGINYPLTTPPDDACVFLWKVNAPNRIWVLPAHRCDWSAYTPTQWHSLVFSQARMSFKEALMIRQMPVDQHGDHDNHNPPGPTSMPQAPHDPPDPPHSPGAPMPQAASAAPAHVSVQPGIHPDTPVIQPVQQPL